MFQVAGGCKPASVLPMRIYIMVCGVLVIAMGITAMSILSGNQALAFLNGSLTLGGGIVISGLFSLKMKWHGIIAAGVMAMLGAAKGFQNIPGLLEFFTGKRPNGVAPLLEFGVTVVCLTLLVSVLAALQKERIRRMLAED